MSETDRGQLSAQIKNLIRGANFGHLATLMRDDAPHVGPGPRVGLSGIGMGNPCADLATESA